MPAGYTEHEMMVCVIVVLAAVPLSVLVYAVYSGIMRRRIDWPNARTLLLLVLIGGALWAAIEVYRQDTPILVTTEQTEFQYVSTLGADECQLFTYLPDDDAEYRYTLMLVTTRNLKTGDVDSSLSVIRKANTVDRSPISTNSVRKFNIVFQDNHTGELRQLKNADGAEIFVATGRVPVERLISKILLGKYVLTRYWGRGDHKIYSVDASVPADTAHQFEACTMRLGVKP